MISLIASTLVNALLFGVLSIFLHTGKLWWFLIPSAFTCIRVYCQLLHSSNCSVADRVISKYPGLFNDNEQIMLRANASRFVPQLRYFTAFVRAECTAAITYVSIGSAIYSVFCVIFRQWIPAIVSFSLFLSVPLLGIGDAFENLDDSEIPTAIRRYLFRRKIDPKKIGDDRLAELANEAGFLYGEVGRKLKALMQKQQTTKADAQTAT
ncbi:MAG: hypothetical protein FD131_4417 [Rhodocyclaceae bacterium]|nr:MAG: hypothetical protein FD131_4417 [Rhodocyclaceae bacterium]